MTLRQVTNASPDPQALFGDIFSENGAERAHWPAGLRDSLTSLSEAGWQRLSAVGFPSRQSESWHYTDPSSLLSRTYRAPSAPPLRVDPSIEYRYRDWPGDILFFYDGRFIPAASRIEPCEGVVLGAFSAFALASGDDAITGELLGILQTAWEKEPDGFGDLSRALFGDGCYLRVKAGVKARPILVIHFLSGRAQRLAPHVTHVYDLEAGARAEILESYEGEVPEGFVGAVSASRLGERAGLCFVRYHGEKNGGVVGRFYCRQERESVLDGLSVLQGDRLVREFWMAEHYGVDASARLNTLALARGGAHFDQRNVVHHFARGGSSAQILKSIVADRARVVANGKIMIGQGAQQVDAKQISRSLLLGDRAEADSKPELEVYADDVKASHGASTGRLDDEQMFYFESRGISRAVATRLLAEGFAQDLVQKVPSSAVSAWLMEAVSRELHGYVTTMEVL